MGRKVTLHFQEILSAQPLGTKVRTRSSLLHSPVFCKNTAKLLKVVNKINMTDSTFRSAQARSLCNSELKALSLGCPPFLTCSSTVTVYYLKLRI